MAKPHDDGTAITCNTCLGKGMSNDIINMHSPFLLSVWDDHCKYKMHNVAMANIEADKEAKHLNRKKQNPTSNFFATIKKKDKTRRMKKKWF